MQKIQVSASILSADMCNLEAVVRTLETSGTDMLHFDVMDGRFVDNISFGIPVLEAIRKKTDLFLDVHLMISDPLHYAERFAKAGANGIWKAKATHRKQLMPFMLVAFQQALSSSQIPQQRQSCRICPPWKWYWS